MRVKRTFLYTYGFVISIASVSYGAIAVDQKMLREQPELLIEPHTDRLIKAQGLLKIVWTDPQSNQTRTAYTIIKRDGALLESSGFVGAWNASAAPFDVPLYGRVGELGASIPVVAMTGDGNRATFVHDLQLLESGKFEGLMELEGQGVRVSAFFITATKCKEHPDEHHRAKHVATTAAERELCRRSYGCRTWEAL